jgi:hypothetical protein
MGGANTGLMKLRPVSFRYKKDPSDTLQYGLVAAEVARVYPELVVHGTDGKVMSVRYLEFTALLLNELQTQARETQELAQRLETKDRQLARAAARDRCAQAKGRKSQPEKHSSVHIAALIRLATKLRSFRGRTAAATTQRL